MPHNPHLRDDILAKCGGDALLDLIAGMGITLVRAGGEHKILCPFHDDKKPSMCINTRKKPEGIFKCFSCGWGGDVFSFVQDMKQCDFVAAMKWIAGQVGIGDAVSMKTHAQPKREAVSRVQSVPFMTPGEVLDEYKAYKSSALDPAPWMNGLGVMPEAMAAIGGVVAPYRPSPDMVVLVVPQRLATGELCSLRFRDFESKRRWSLDVKERRGGERVQVKSTRSGLMSIPESWDEDYSLDGTTTFWIEGETDLLAGVSMLMRDRSMDPNDWPIRFVGLPGVGSCHEMVTGLRRTDSNVLFFDGDGAAMRAVFYHRPTRKTDRGMEADLDRDPVPGLLQKCADAGMNAVAAFPPKATKKYDLRDMYRDGWTIDRLVDHCIRHGTADPHGIRARRARVTA